MNAALKYTFGLGITLFLVGCGTIRVSPKRVESGPNEAALVKDKIIGEAYLSPALVLNGSAILLVQDVDTKKILLTKDIDPDDLALLFKHELIAGLTASGAFHEVVAKVDGNTPPSHLYLLRSEFVELDPGNRALRYMTPGAGRVKVEVQTTIEDTDTKAIVFKGASRRIAIMGVFGGNSAGFITKSLAEIAKDYEKYFTQTRSTSH